VATAEGQRVADGTVMSIVCSTANPTPYGDYPNPASESVTFNLQEGGTTAGGFTPLALADEATETVVDDVTCTLASLAVAASSPNRLLYVTPPLTAPMHLSGLAEATVRLASSRTGTSLAATLVRLPWTGSSTCTASTIGTSTSVVTRGWADPQNHESLTSSAPLVPGQFYDVTFPLQPDDQILPVGTRLGLMITASDREFTIRPTPGTELTVDLAATSLDLPVVGGRFALGICAAADERATVVIGDIVTRVPNHSLAGNCSINSHLMDGEDWPTAGEFVAHVTGVADDLLAAGLINGREHDAIVGAAARSRIDETSDAGGSVSVRFAGGEGAPSALAAGSPTSQPLNCNTLQPTGPATPTAAVGSVVYDEATDTDRYPWASSAGGANTCRLISITLVDGATRVALCRGRR
jgi:X-Pro dipeptidyl-peptidase